MRTLAARIVAAAALAAGIVSSGTGAHALPAMHTINGTATNSGGDTVQVIAASELLQNGTLIVNGVPATINCVAVTTGLGPGQHKVYISATGGGAIWGVEIAESGSSQFMAVGFMPGNPCNAGAPVLPLTSGSYTILI